MGNARVNGHEHRVPVRQSPTLLVRVIPPPPTTTEGHTRGLGTKVLLPSGEAIKGVQKVTLEAEPDGLWRASLELNAVPPPELTAVLGSILIEEPDPPPAGFWGRVLAAWRILRGRGA